MAKSPELSKTPGQRTPLSDANQFSALQFVMQQYLAGVRTAMPVIIRGVRNNGGVEPVGSVDVEPLVAQLDGSGKIISHGIIYDLPYMRLQGGGNAIIIDPQVGDIGLAVIADRDVGNVKSTREVSAPGSRRRNSFADGFYFGGFMNSNPAQYIRFSSEGIDLVSPTAINLKAPNINQIATESVSISAPEIGLDGALTQGKGQHGGDASFGGSVNAEGEVIGNGIALSDHGHDGVERGEDQSGGPVNL